MIERIGNMLLVFVMHSLNEGFSRDADHVNKTVRSLNCQKRAAKGWFAGCCGGHTVF